MGSLSLPEALALVGLPADTGATALPMKWHGDRQWRLAGSMNLRVIRAGRTSILEDDDPVRMATVAAQAAVGEAFRAAGIPFMRLLAGPIGHGDDIVLLYAWVAGDPLPAPTTASAHTVGAVLRRLHEVGAGLVRPALPVHDKAAAARITLRRVRDVVPHGFIEQAETTIEAAAISDRAPIAGHSDLNLPNVLWTGPNVLAGVVDLDQSGPARTCWPVWSTWIRSVSAIRSPSWPGW